MLSVTQLDFANYWRSFKGNYSKGIRNLANILQTPQQATDLAKNLGGVSVLLGTPVGEEDVNSLQLRTMLLESPYADTAVETWLKGHYTFDTLHDLFSDSTVRAEVFNSELLWRSVSISSVAMAMYIGDIVSLDPEEYGDMQAVAASTVAMQAVAASTVAMQAVAASTVAMQAVINSPTALNAVVNSTVAMQAVAASTVAMQAVAASYVAVTAIWMNSSAVAVVKANSSAWAVFSNPSSAVIGKAVCVIVGLNPNSYADMQAVAASSTAMQAVAASSTAMQAVAASSTAISACAASTVAKNALVASPLRKTYTWNSKKWTANPLTIVSGQGLLIRCKILDNTGAWSLPGSNNHKLLLDGSSFTATNGHSTEPIYQQATSAEIDFSVRKYNSSIQVYLYNQTEIIYIPV